MEKRSRAKIKLIGLFLLTSGISIVVYSILFASSKSAFLPMYIGFTMVVTGLGMLGFNVSGYPF